MAGKVNLSNIVDSHAVSETLGAISIIINNFEKLQKTGMESICIDSVRKLLEVLEESK